MSAKLERCPECGQEPNSRVIAYADFGAQCGGHGTVSCCNPDCLFSDINAMGPTESVARTNWNRIVRLARKGKKKPRCCHLDIDGKRCGQPAIGSFTYHGDTEIYFGEGMGWMIVQLCKEHSAGMDRFRARKQRAKR